VRAITGCAVSNRQHKVVDYGACGRGGSTESRVGVFHEPQTGPCACHVRLVNRVRGGKRARCNPPWDFDHGNSSASIPFRVGRSDSYLSNPLGGRCGQSGGLLPSEGLSSLKTRKPTRSGITRVGRPFWYSTDHELVAWSTPETVQELAAPQVVDSTAATRQFLEAFRAVHDVPVVDSSSGVNSGHPGPANRSYRRSAKASGTGNGGSPVGMRESCGNSVEIWMGYTEGNFPH